MVCSKRLSRILSRHKGTLVHTYRSEYVEITVSAGFGVSRDVSEDRTGCIFRLFCCLRLAWLNLRPQRWRQNFPPKLRRTSTQLHGVTSQKIVRLTRDVSLISLRNRWSWCGVGGVVLKNQCFSEGYCCAVY